ncbi:MAG: CBS domain-containing protein, partial [Pseudomonadota bacterium]
MICLYDRAFDGEILSELDESIREEVIAVLRPTVLAEAVRELDSDDVVDLIEDLDDAQQEQILDALEDSDRAMVEQSLSFPEYSAGRLMQREVVMAPEHWTVGEAIDRMRLAPEEDLPRQFYHLVLVDPRLHPVGNVTLGKLMRSRREVMLKDLVEETFQVIPATQDESDVAYAFNQYHLISAPVVDDEGRLIGAITIDDAMAVLDEEHEED